MHRTPNWTELREKNNEFEDSGKDPNGSTERETKESVGGENRAKEKYYDIYVIGLAQGQERIEKK